VAQEETMSGDILRMLFDQLLLIEGLVLAILLSIMLLRERYLLNRRRREIGVEPSQEPSPTPASFAPARHLRRVH